MCDDKKRIEELTARIAVLEAAVRTGKAGAAPAASGSEKYAFLDKLSGDDLISAKALVEENAQLRAEVAELKETVAQRDYRIEHMKRGIDGLMKKE